MDLPEVGQGTGREAKASTGVDAFPRRRFRLGQGRSIAAFWGCVFVITLTGAALRWSFLGHPMRYDEAHNYLEYGHRSPGYIATRYESPNNHVLHTLLMRASVAAFGSQPWAIRLPAFVAGIALIPLSAALSWMCFRHRGAAVLTCICLATSSVLVEYSVNARGYSWAAVFAVAGGILTAALLERDLGISAWIVWGAILAMANYVVPVAGLAVVALVVAVLTSLAGRSTEHADRSGLARGLVVGASVCVLMTTLFYAPIIWSEGLATIVQGLNLSMRVYAEYLREHDGAAWCNWQVWGRHGNGLWAAAIIPGLGLCLWKWRFLTPPTQGLAGGWAIVCLVVSLAGLPLVPPSWIVAVPFAAALALGGLFRAIAAIRPAGRRQVAVLTISGMGAVAGFWSLANVSAATHVTTWERELVDVEAVLDEWSSFGPTRSSLLAEYTPTMKYHRLRRGLGKGLPPEDGQVTRVYIVATARKSLAALWNPSLPGFERFGEPMLARKLERCNLFIAEASVPVAAVNGEVLVTESAAEARASGNPPSSP